MVLAALLLTILMIWRNRDGIDLRSVFHEVEKSVKTDQRPAVGRKVEKIPHSHVLH